jgi:two-component system osmolarity sensor histidine kinase EnvZ
MENDIETMNGLIAQLLEIARGLSTEPVAELHLCDWLTERAQLHAAAAAGSTLTVRCNPDLRVRAAPGMLARVLDNLIDNALRYAPGAVDLVGEYVAGSSDAAFPTVRIGVLDRGPGIPADQLEAVFRPFHRVEPSRSPITGGFGLGLAIVRQLARANGWRVDLARRDGGGLEVWVTLEAAD